jgi:hypothetical protein
VYLEVVMARRRFLAVASLLLGACGCPTDTTPSVLVHVTDAATGQPIAGVMFFENGAPAAGTCGDPMPTAACKEWQFVMVGMHTLTVTAPGYMTTSFTVDAGMRTAPCGVAMPAQIVTADIRLTK